MKRIPYIVGLLLALIILVGIRLPFLRCEPFVAGAPLLFDEKDYLHGARSFAAGDNTNDLAEAWIRAPATAWTLLTIANLRGVPPELAGCDFQIIQIAMWAVIVLLVADIAVMLFDRHAALASAFLLAPLPLAMSVTVMVHADTLFCLLFVATIWAQLRYTRRMHLAWIVLAGVSAGLATLTRSLLLPMLPFLVLWMIYEVWKANLNARDTNVPALWQWRAVGQSLKTGSWRLLVQIALPCLLFVGIMALELAPWVIRNYQLYGGFIPSDTTGAINLFHNNGSGPGVNFQTIRAYSQNPVERQRYAMQLAWEFIRNDPPRFIHKFLSASLFGWSPDSFPHTLDFYTAVTEQPRWGGILAQLTVLFWLAIPLLMLGWLFGPHHAAGAASYRWVMLGTALLYTVMMGATHFEDRYRLPYMLIWLPYAGWSLAHLRTLITRLWRPAGLIAVAVLLTASLSYISLLVPWQPNNAQALLLHERGWLRERMGDVTGALVDQQAAAAVDPELREARVAAALLQMRQGDLNDAEQTLSATIHDTQELGMRTPADATVALQQVLLAQGRNAESKARDALLAPSVRQRAEELAWQHGVDPSHELNLTSNDFGLVNGFYSASEQDSFRWSRPQARMLLAGQGQYVCLHASASRPLDIAAPLLTLSARINDAAATTLTTLHPPRQGWAWFCAALPSLPSGNPQIEIAIQVTGYNPFATGHAKDARDLGIAISNIALRDGPLTIDPATGLLLDRVAPTADSNQTLQLIGINGDLHGHAGDSVPITLWWRDQQTPPTGIFSFLHLIDANGQNVADYNAPLAGDQHPQPWSATEPLIDQTALALPTDLTPGRYRLIGGAFDLASGARVVEADFGEFVVE